MTKQMIRITADSTCDLSPAICQKHDISIIPLTVIKNGESFKDSGLVRCHRKYIVNIKKVKVLRKETEGYFLELDNEAVQP